VEAQEKSRVLRAGGTLRAVLTLIGFTAVIAQIVLMRELVKNERGGGLSGMTSGTSEEPP
jgi:hypothetical protein